MAIASAEITRPAPTSPERLPVEALTFTASVVKAQERRDPLAHGRQRRTDPRPAGADGQVDGNRPPARAASRPTIPSSSSLLAMPAPGPLVGRVDRPQVAEAGGAEQRAADRVERRVAVGVAVEARRGRDLDPAEPQPVARPEGVDVGGEAHA